MPQPKPHRLGDLQLKIMKILWLRREAPVAEIHEKLCTEKALAYTTVATMLRKMEARGMVSHRTEGRTFVYQPGIAEEDVSRGMVDHLVDRIFEGSLASTVSHLLSSREVSEAELSQLEDLIQAKKKEAK